MIRGERIVLRPVELSDLDKLYQWENDASAWPYSDRLNPLSRFYLEQYIIGASNDIRQDKQLRLMIVNHNQDPVGMIDLFDYDPHHRRAGLGIMIAADQRSRGYATEALRLVVDYAKHTLMLKQLFCNITDGNHQSIRLFKKQGFQHAGTKKAWSLINGAWKDQLFLQLVFGLEESQPA